VKCNGTYGLLVQTRHGQFRFQNQKFFDQEHGSHAFLQASADYASAVTRGLEALALSTCLLCASYQKACQMLTEVTGECLLTRQTLCNWVEATAKRLDKSLQEDAKKAQQYPLPPLAATVDVYDPSTPEVIVFEDGILVKAQKPTHEKGTQTKQPKPAQFHQSYFALAPYPEGTYAFVLGTRDGSVSLIRALRDFVATHWQQPEEPLCLVAITDGAKDLRNDLRSAFGARVVVILDWYHLRKKVCELCSMLVSTKEARTELKKQMLGLLFYGKVSEALAVLACLPVRNAFMHTKLVTYLTNHADTIIDYSRRAKVKKTIGSGRMEKGVDQVIGIRQKDKGMSWSKSGSYALGMLTAYHANGDWEQLWNAGTSVI
jgi:hypothetical protein